MGAAKLARESVEVLVQSQGPARLARESVEVIVQSQGPARLARASVEVLVSDVVSAPPAAFRWGALL